MSFAELLHRSRRLAAWLVDRGIERGCPVAIFAANGNNAVVCHFASILADTLIAPIDFDGARLHALLADSGTRQRAIAERPHHAMTQELGGTALS